jgi:hypothetical protein
MISILRILIREDVLTFIVGISLFIFVFSTILNISSTEQLFQDNITPINIYTKGDTNLPFFLGVVMKEGSDNAVVLINQWEDPDNQSDFLITFSEPVDNIELALQKKPGGDNRTRILDFADRRHVPYSKMYPETSNTKISQLFLNPQNISHFYGVECNVKGIVRRVSSFQKTVSVPLKIDPKEEIDGYKPVKNVIVQVVPPGDYTAQDSIPQAEMLSLIGDHLSANEFEVDTTKTDLFVLYENRFIERDIRIMDVILGMIISLATFYIATGFLKIVAPLNISLFKDNSERKEIMLINQGRRFQRTLRGPRTRWR